MKRKTPEYAVASDNTVVRLRELAYRDGVRDALRVIKHLGNVAAETSVVGDFLSSQIRKQCKRKYT